MTHHYKAVSSRGGLVEAAPVQTATARRSRTSALISGLSGYEWAALGLMAIGVALRAIEYFANPSQWLDEILLSTNILGHPLSTLLLGRLDLAQSAPIGFLGAEKLLVLVFGSSDLVLRLIPFASSVVVLLAFFVLARRLLSGIALPVAMALVAFAAPLIIYAGQVKQYSPDVAVVLLLSLLAFNVRDEGFDRRAGRFAILGAVSCWISQAAVISLIGLGAVLLWQQRSRRRDDPHSFRAAVIVVAVWLVSAVGATIAGWAKLTADTRSYLHSYWAAGFMPLPPWRPSDVVWPLRSLKLLLGHGQSGLQYPAAYVFVTLALVGLVRIAKRLPGLTALLVAPTAAALVAAVLQQYPFSDRLILFVVPVLLLGIAEAIGWLVAILRPRVGPILAAAPLLLVVPLIYPVAASMPPYRKEDVRPALEQLAAERRPGDTIFVYYAAEPAFRYYAGRLGLDDATIGGCHRGENAEYLKEIDRLRGQPWVWVVFSHDLPLYNEQQDMTRYLDAIGTRLSQRVVVNHQPHGSPDNGDAEAILYDLRESAASTEVSAETFPVTDVTLDGRLTC